jgi:hypothetical protein
MLKITATKRPISGDVIGYRIVAAIPNMAGRNYGKEVPSFRKPYFVCESSDLPSVSVGDVARFMDGPCKWAGYSDFVAVGEIGDLMSCVATPATEA